MERRIARLLASTALVPVALALALNITAATAQDTSGGVGGNGGAGGVSSNTANGGIGVDAATSGGGGSGGGAGVNGGAGGDGIDPGAFIIPGGPGGVGPGGNGSDGQNAISAASGGGGGAHGYVGAGLPVATITGGRGGNGGDGFEGGGGGAGGYGAVETGGGSLGTLAISVAGGNGGNGGVGSASSGAGGDGGHGLVLTSASELTIGAAVSGGNGGSGNGTGAGGYGLVGGDLAITLGATVSGGLGAGAVRADALYLTGGTNTLVLDSGWALNGGINIAAGTLTFDQSDDVSLSNVISGAGEIIKNNSNTLTLSGANSYAGGTTVNGGTLMIGVDTVGTPGAITSSAIGTGTLTMDGGALATAGDFTVANDIVLLTGTLVSVDSTSTLTLSGVISNNVFPRGITKRGTGTLVLTGNNSHSGTMLVEGIVNAGHDNALGIGQINAEGGTLEIQDGITIANDALLGSDLTITIGAGATGTYTGLIQENGGPFGFTKTGTGTLILGGINLYSGATSINAGTLQGGAGNAFNALSDFTIASGATLDLGGFDQDIGSLAGAGIVTNSGGANATLFVGAFGINSNNTIFSGVIQDGGTNATALEVETSGILTLTGASTYTGGTVICDCATLQIGDGGTTGSIVGDITHNGVLIFNRSDDYEFAGDILQGFGAAGVVRQDGDGVLTLSGNNDYAGGTIINAGTLFIQDDENLGDVLGTVTINGATLKLGAFANLDEDRTISLTSLGGTIDVDAATPSLMGIDSIITGAGQLTVTGDNGYLTLFGVNDYSGGTRIMGGATVIAEVDENFGDVNGGVLLNNGAIFFFDDFTLAASRTVTLGAGGGSFIINSDGEVAGTITGSGALTVLVDPDLGAGGGDLYLTGINDYTGGTILQGFGAFGIPASLVIVDDRNLGDLSGDITIDTGEIFFDANVTLNSGRAITVNGDGALFDVDNNIVTIAGVISGNGPMAKDGDGTLILTGANTNTGLLDIIDGSLQVGNGGTTGSISATVITSSAVLAFNRSNTLVFAIDITDFDPLCGCLGSVLQMGSGTTILTGDNDYTGGTTISAGTLQIGNGGTVGVIVGDVTNNGALVFNRSDNISFAGIVSGGGTLTQTGSGVLTIDAVNTYSGNTIVTAGVLRLGAGASLGTGGLVLNGGQFDLNGGTLTLTTLSGTGGTLALGTGTLNVNIATDGTLASNITGTGSIIKNGAGVMTLSGDNSGFSGGFTIAGGTISFANDNAAGTGTITTTGSVIDYAAGITLNIGININSNTTQLQVLSGTATQGGVISQTGGPRPLEKIGSGNLVLTRINTYTGATTVTGGTLTVNGSIASSDVTVASGATLGGTGTVGAVTVQSGGTLAPGHNDVGTLTVNGNLTLAAGSSFGVEVGPASADRVTVNGNAALGGSLFANFQTGVTYTPGQTSYTLVSTSGTVSGTFSSFNTLGIPSGYRADLVYGSNNLVLNLSPNDYIWSATAASGDWNTASNWTYGIVPDIARTAEFAASSRTAVTVAADAAARTIQLDSGAPAYSFAVTGSTLTIAEGITQLSGNAASFTASSGGTIAFSTSGSAADSLLTATNGGTISFAGNAHAGAGAQITAQSGGVVDFTATSGPAGNNQVRAGSLAGAGSIRLGANRLETGMLNSSTEFSGVISGAGGLYKSGTGTLTLSGVNTYTGATTVSTGTLVVNGSLASNVTLVGGALKGGGTIAGLTANAGSTVAPGNSIGTLNVGSVTFANGASYEVEVNAAGQSDLINATGTASLNGMVQVIAATGSYAPATTYRILNAAGGVSGTFSGVTSSVADLTPSLVYSANAVDLRLMRNNIQFGNAYGNTPNQIAAGGGVSAGGAGSALYNAIANGYTAPTIGATLDGLSGEIYASQRSAALEDSRIIRNTVLARLASNPEGTGGWAYGFADSGTLDSDGNAGEGTRQNAGLIAGVDFMVGEGLRLGVGGAYGENKLSIASRASTAHGHLGSLLAYVSYRRNSFSLNLGGDYGWGESGAVRAMAVPAGNAAADRNVEVGSIFAQASYDFGLPVIPYAGITHVSLSHGAFTESGGIAALSGAASSDTKTYSTLGLRAPVGSFDVYGMALTPRIDIGWSHAFDAAAPVQQVRFPTLQGFTVLGAPIGSDAAALQLGFDLTIVPGATLSAGYDGTFSGRGQSHAIRGGLNWRF